MAPNDIRFPDVTTSGGSSTATVTVRYVSKQPADVLALVDTDYFSVEPADCGVLTAGRTCVFHLRFTPDPTMVPPGGVISLGDILHVLGPVGYLTDVTLGGWYRRP